MNFARQNNSAGGIQLNVNFSDSGGATVDTVSVRDNLLHSPNGTFSVAVDSVAFHTGIVIAGLRRSGESKKGDGGACSSAAAAANGADTSVRVSNATSTTGGVAVGDVDVFRALQLELAAISATNVSAQMLSEVRGVLRVTCASTQLDNSSNNNDNDNNNDNGHNVLFLCACKRQPFTTLPAPFVRACVRVCQ